MTTLTGQLAPYSQEAEEAVLGAVLVNPDAFLSVAAFLTADDFYILRHSYIWDAFRRIVERDEVIDYVTVVAELEAVNRLNDIGGPAYLLHLTNSTPTSMRAAVYGHVVERAAMRRRLLVAADEIKALALDEQLSAEKISVEAWQRLEHANLAGDREAYMSGKTSIQHYDQLVLDLREQRERGERVSLELPASWQRLQAVLPALFLGDFVVVSGGSGSGKSAVLECLSEHFAQQGVPTDYIHTEMSTDEVLHRRMARHSGVPFHLLASGTIDPQPSGFKPYARMVEADGRIGEWIEHLAYHWLPDVPFARLAMHLRRAAMMGVKVFCIDHFQDIVPSSDRGMSEVRALEQMCVWLNAFAEKRRVLVVVASQLNDSGKVKWTRKLNEKADVWLNIKRSMLKTEYVYSFEDVEYRAQPGEDSPEVELYVGKARFGKKAKVKMLYHGPRFQLLDMSQIKRPAVSGKVLDLEEIKAQHRSEASHAR